MQTTKPNPTNTRTPIDHRDVVEAVMLALAAFRDGDIDGTRECLQLADRMLDQGRHYLED